MFTYSVDVPTAELTNDADVHLGIVSRSIRDARSRGEVGHVNLVIWLTELSPRHGVDVTTSMCSRDLVDEVWVNAAYPEDVHGDEDRLAMWVECPEGSETGRRLLRGTDAAARQREFTRAIMALLADSEPGSRIVLELMPYWGQAGVIFTRDLLNACTRDATAIRLRLGQHFRQGHFA